MKTTFKVTITLDSDKVIYVYVQANNKAHALKRAQKEYSLYNKERFSV